jgi:hypothetical protein
VLCLSTCLHECIHAGLPVCDPQIHEATVHEPVTRVDGTQDIKNSKFSFDHVFHEEDDTQRVFDCILQEKLE